MKKLTIVLLAISCGNATADWRAFRGTHSNGVADGPAPARCDDADIAWSSELPGRSVSSPIVVGGQVIVTASSGVNRDRLHVMSLDANTGDKNWHRQFWATGRTMSHPTSANAAPTAASDGEHLVASFSSNDVVCLNLDGELLWFRGLGHDYPKAANDIGMSSSPVVAAGVAVCQMENQGDSFVEGIDLLDGTTRWRLQRPQGFNWTSPVCLPGERDLVLLKNGEGVRAHAIRTGELVWQVDAEVGGISSMAVNGNHIVVPGSTFVVLDRAGDRVQVAWDSKTLKPDPSPVVTDHHFYMINSAGVLSAHQLADGDTLWKTRVGGKHWASPVLAGNLLYTVNQEGELNIVDSATGKKLDSHDFEHEVMGTPAVSDGALFVRGVNRIWKVATP